jgi:hypothetical protein
MTHKVADDWFNNVDFVSIVSTVKGIMTSDGSMSVLLDFERVLDEIDIYAFKNWLIGELVQGPDVGRYTVSCIFMWPYKLMPDPRAVKRLLAIGCDVQWTKKEIMVPIEVKNYDDFVQGTNYPKGVKRKVWLVKITIPIELMDDMKEGSIDIAGSTIDLEEIDSAYDDDLDKQGVDNQEAATAEEPVQAQAVS